ncbi:unnamed protein product [Strongylus vulgaris]|uniref:Uncharacterized protein n=1 Tax=Strongylus vulgaris TaxID=40348 RepID=A0A3P7JFE2_STRVU|nr:unnamed protein product [Strongylus vulgaris]
MMDYARLRRRHQRGGLTWDLWLLTMMAKMWLGVGMGWRWIAAMAVPDVMTLVKREGVDGGGLRVFVSGTLCYECVMRMGCLSAFCEMRMTVVEKVLPSLCDSDEWRLPSAPQARMDCCVNVVFSVEVR